MVELIDVYDRDRNRTGKTIERNGAFLQEGEYVLYVLAVIEDMQGRYLITQRSHLKSWGAGWWETCGGGVPSGESSDEAVVREVREETGLDVSGLELERIYSYENVDLERGDNYLVDIYRFCLDFTLEDVTLQEEETVDCRLATWQDIEALHDEGIFLHFDRLKAALGA